jgi:3-methylfumaryl-CoA hydratase
MSVVDIEELQAWIGRTETRDDVIAAAPAAYLSATLDHGQSLAVTGEPLPPGWHWLFFLDAVQASGVDADGHAKRGGFMPPVPLPRRMWAGSRLRFLAPLKVGDEARRVTTIADVQHKQGRSGELVFVSLLHQVFSGDRLAIEEEQDLVYRGELTARAADNAPAAPAAPQWTREIRPDPVLLFRYSALTFNSHRIHYDRDYATRTEGYESLVVQGPLTATLLLDLLHRELPDAEARTFRFRAVRPLLEGSPLKLQGRREGETALLWALDATGALAMEARVSLAKIT